MLVPLFYRTPLITAQRGVLTNPIHLYRRCIRLSNVLYDDVARNYISRHIRLRFKKNKDSKGHSLVQDLRAARHACYSLEKANAGVPKVLEKIMRMSYGRIGKRRHELLQPILNYDKPNNYPPDAPPFVSEKFKLLLTWAQTKNINIKIPEKNDWDQPFPKVRADNMLVRGHTRLIGMCPAPLPLDEYRRLERLANGEEFPVPARRKKDLDFLEKFPIIEDGRPREMSHRAWRRVWGKLLDETPSLDFIEGTKKWVVVSTAGKARRPKGQLEEFDFSKVSGSA